MPKNYRPQYVAQLDQYWAHARDWCRTANGEVLMQLADVLSSDDPRPLIDWMARDPKLADIVQRLALLTLHQSMFDTFEKAADEIDL